MTSFVAEIVRGDGPVRATGVSNPREGNWIAGDVRLDARDELRDALGAAGVATPRDAGDVSLVLAAWTTWRETATERLRGDFSFALWDGARRTLFCARDPLGVRPLYWAQAGASFVCANTIDAVRAHAAISSRLHEPAIVSFLRLGYNDDLTTTTFADVRRLPPAHQLLVTDASGPPVPRRYWSFPTPAPLRLKRDEEYVERYRDVLGAAVRDRLRGDRAAILLSGGLDSTSLAATARRVAPDVSLLAWTTDTGPSGAGGRARLAAPSRRALACARHHPRRAGSARSHLDDPAFRSPEPLDEPEWNAMDARATRTAPEPRGL